MDYAIRVSHYVDPVTFEVQRDVIVLISGAHVADVIVGGEVSGGLDGLAKQTLDFDNAVCMPGFVNAHCHLDLSHLHNQVPRGLTFPEWAPAVIAGRAMPQAMIEGGIDDACQMLVASGTTGVIDISVGGDSAKFMSKHGLRGIAALEVLGGGSPGSGSEKAMQRADEIVRSRFELDRNRLGEDAGDASAPTKPEGVDYGFSPHAPYSTGMELYQHAFGRAFGERRLCTTHVAESLEEVEFVSRGTGPLYDLLTTLGVDLSGFGGFGTSPIALLLGDWLGPWLGAENPSLVLVHCNYAQDGDLELLAATRPSVCWCPRSHAWFGHEPWPLAKMHEAGVNLVLGTDSLASNSGLDMLSELRLAAQHPDADIVELFKAATINGREAMGTIKDAADLAIWGLPNGDNVFEGMLKSEVPLYASFSRGQLIARAI
ncbi:MAG: amidohydrolase family protein [Planctomycetes bacterium]|nr:amidohydrolase family protein [Planctomycetota bacterium]